MLQRLLLLLKPGSGLQHQVLLELHLPTASAGNSKRGGHSVSPIAGSLQPGRLPMHLCHRKVLMVCCCRRVDKPYHLINQAVAG